MLGLAQMYQLRGRVGRGARHAYAYFLITPGVPMTEAAQKRLKAMLAYQELGAGFRIAMKDLEIRGAGNILGPEQSGHVHAIGFDLYTRLLEEAVADLRAEQAGEPLRPRTDLMQVSVDLPLEAYIPEDYIADLPSRLGAYGRLARAADTEEAVIIGEELRDRFGPTPAQVENLVYAVRIKALAPRRRRRVRRPRGRGPSSCGCSMASAGRSRCCSGSWATKLASATRWCACRSSRTGRRRWPGRWSA